MAVDFEWGERTVNDGIVAFALRVPADLRYFEGHFPGDPIVPGVAQLTAIAETAIRREFPDLGSVKSVQRLKFMAALRPGDALVLSLRRRDAQVDVSIARGETECTSASFVFEPGA
jgi:3-hydroxymyristoyl/3-hydroxydecanoyl-(acyl carrier protein) dehydratase